MTSTGITSDNVMCRYGQNAFERRVYADYYQFAEQWLTQPKGYEPVLGDACDVAIRQCLKSGILSIHVWDWSKLGAIKADARVVKLRAPRYQTGCRSQYERIIRTHGQDYQIEHENFVPGEMIDCAIIYMVDEILYRTIAVYTRYPDEQFYNEFWGTQAYNYGEDDDVDVEDREDFVLLPLKMWRRGDKLLFVFTLADTLSMGRYLGCGVEQAYQRYCEQHTDSILRQWR